MTAPNCSAGYKSQGVLGEQDWRLERGAPSCCRCDRGRAKWGLGSGRVRGARGVKAAGRCCGALETSLSNEQELQLALLGVSESGSTAAVLRASPRAAPLSPSPPSLAL